MEGAITFIISLSDIYPGAFMRPARSNIPQGVFHEGPAKDFRKFDIAGPMSIDRKAAHGFAESLRKDDDRQDVLGPDLEAMAGADTQAKIRSSFRLGAAVSEGKGTRMLALSFAGGLSDPDEKVRTNCCWGLGRMALHGMPIGAAVPGLYKALEDPCRDVRANAAIALMVHYANRSDERAMDILVNHPKVDVRRSAAGVLPHLTIS